MTTRQRLARANQRLDGVRHDLDRFHDRNSTEPTSELDGQLVALAGAVGGLYDVVEHLRQVALQLAEAEGEA